ncbi:hypothetical protein K1719_022440 [Acacia pycnantha]|nr:hypothetical protein K1719_022344 [Acacia pycnantha]KAI9106912.1 hypothetical protein K1719_022440 [Acacia pycnantha]
MAISACYLSIVFLVLYVALAVSADTKDELVAMVNAKRIAHRLSSLHVSPGLTCIAVQYIKAYEGDCEAVGEPDEKKPPESAFYASYSYVDADQAFSEIIITNQESLDILYSENHTQVGVAVAAIDRGPPYFWCVLFSNGEPNSTFVFYHAAFMAQMTRIVVFIIVTHLVVYLLLPI